MRITQKKGDIAKAKAVSTFTALGYDVSLPLTESAPLIVDTGTKLLKVQVKYSSSKHVDLRRIHSNSKGYVVKLYNKAAFDLLYIYRPDGEEYIVSDVDSRIGDRTGITPNEHNSVDKFVASYPISIG